jgi:type IV secretory pathway VirB9-like protein
VKRAGRIAAIFAAMLPLGAQAQTPSYVTYAPVSEKWFPHVHVQTGTTIDVALVTGDEIDKANIPVVGDPRWILTVFMSGGTTHVILKPAANLTVTQLVTIPGVKRTYHLLIDSGPAEGSTYALAYVCNRQGGCGAATGNLAVSPAAAPSPSPTIASVPVCAPPLFEGYKVTGDKRIDVAGVCDDGIRTYIIMRGGSRGPSVTPYQIDVGGKQDQLVNPQFVAGLNEWVLSGTYEHLALLTDSSKGQIRKNIDRSK